MGSRYVRMWTIHNLDAIEIEGGKTYSNSNYTLLKWCIWKFLATCWLLKKSIVEHSSCKGIRYLKNTRFDKPIVQFIISKLISALIQHGYNAHHLWNSNEIGIQARRQSNACVLTKHGSHQVYNIIPKSKEWWIVNYAVDTNNIYIGILHFEGSETT
jgi:hypothetical protein